MFQFQISQKARSTSILLVMVLLFSQLACKTLSQGTAPGDSLPPTQVAAPTATKGEVRPVESPTADLPPTPAPEIMPAPTGTEPGNAPPVITGPAACFGSTGNGLSCLFTDGWRNFVRDNSALDSDYVGNIEACPDGRLAVVNTSSVAIYDSKQWKSYDGSSGMLIGASAVACDSQGGFWVSYMQGATHYNGSQYTDYSGEQIAGGMNIFDDIAVSPDGMVWIISNDTVSSFDGEKWATFKEGQGFNETFFFKSVEIDSTGKPWVGYSSGVLSFDGETWQENGNSKMGSVNDFALDSQGRAWVATTDGVYLLENGGWQTIDLQKEVGVSNYAKSIAVDAANQVWVGTKYGVAAFDGNAWTGYFMHNSELRDNDVTAVAVAGSFEDLPQAVDKPTGSLTAKILDASGAPIASAPIEVCVLTLGDTYYGETPCADQPFIAKGQTDATGSFTIEDLPSGYYIITIKTGSTWAQLVGQFGVFSERVLVNPGENTDVGEIHKQ